MRTQLKAAAAVATAALVGGVATTAWAAPSANTPASGGGGVSDSTTTIPPRVFAVVNPDGSKLRGKGVSSTAKLSTGTYDIRFSRNISTCAWTATVGFGGFGGSTGPAMITVTGRSGTTNGLFVTTYNGSATPNDEPFHVVVICA